MTERLSRPERRALQKADALTLSLALTMGSDPRPLAAHVRHVVRLLRDEVSASPSDAAAHVTALFDRTIAAHPPTLPALACRKGCGHCCSQKVVVTAPEAFLVANAVRKRPGVIAALAADRVQERLPCALLDDAVCSIYVMRPLGCRGFVSVDLNACLAAFVHSQVPHIPMPQNYVAVLHTCRLILKVGLMLAGFGDGAYELHAAVAAILQTEHAEKRWRMGEDVFAHLACDRSVPADVQRAADQMAAFVAPTI